MVACSIGDVTVFTGAAGLRVDGVNCVLGALSFECSIGSRPLIYVRALRRNCLVIVTMARSYQSAAGYERRCTDADELLGGKSKAFNRKDRKGLAKDAKKNDP
jgi:hypothetical protein